MNSSIPQLTALELLEAYQTKALSPVEVVTALLGRAESLNGKLNAFYAFDTDAALEAARLSEERWMKGRPCGPLDGIPSSIKDALPSKGVPSYRGSAAHRADEQTWEVDAPPIARMREAGAIFLGKTTMPDFGILSSCTSSKHGVSTNPWDLTKTPGGSSGGTSSSIAAGINPLAVGTDIAGSVRLPASFCGLVGHKPSYGRAPYHFPNSPALVAGPMARTVADAALLMNVMARPDPRDFTALPYDAVNYCDVIQQPVRKARIGFIESLGFGLKPDPEVVALVRARVDELAAEGFQVESIGEPFTHEDLRNGELFYKVRCRAELTTMPPERQKEAVVISEWSREADGLSATEFYRIFNEQQRMRERAARLCDGFDFLILPAVHIPAFDAELPGPNPDCYFEPFVNCFLFNLTEQPASSIPCGFTKGGLPVGLQIVGRRYDDVGVFQLAAHIEKNFATRSKIDALIAGL